MSTFRNKYNTVYVKCIYYIYQYKIICYNVYLMDFEIMILHHIHHENTEKYN